jgi:soluble cytochrome b562
LGIKQKSLFDHLIEDAQTLKLIAREVEYERFNRISRIQKTFVISRKTLSSLDETSKRFNAPRDALVEYSIQRLLPVIAREREKHRRRKEILRDMNANIENASKILYKSGKLLGEDDPVFIRWQSAMKTLVNARDDIGVFIEKGKIIEEF